MMHEPTSHLVMLAINIVVCVGSLWLHRRIAQGKARGLEWETLALCIHADVLRKRLMWLAEHISAYADRRGLVPMAAWSQISVRHIINESDTCDTAGPHPLLRPDVALIRYPETITTIDKRRMVEAAAELFPEGWLACPDDVPHVVVSFPRRAGQDESGS